MTKLVKSFRGGKVHGNGLKLFYSSHVAVFILDISTPLVSVDLIGKTNIKEMLWRTLFECDYFIRRNGTAWYETSMSLIYQRRYQHLSQLKLASANRVAVLMSRDGIR